MADKFKALLESLKYEDEEVRPFVLLRDITNCGAPYRWYLCPRDTYGPDLAACVERTLHVLKDAGFGDDMIYAVAGLEPEKEFEASGEAEEPISIDLGYVLPPCQFLEEE